MQYRVVLSLVVFFAICLKVTGLVRGHEPASRFEDDQTDRQDTIEDDDSLSMEIAELKEAIARLERKIDQLAQRPSEFTPVEVRIVDEEGKPMSGYEVQLSSVGDVQAARATGVSDDDGIGLTRDLPYGRYRMTVEGNEWRARDLVTLEVGKPLDLTVVAPTTGQYSELILRSELATETIGDFPFGEWEVKSQNGWGNRIVPSPDGSSEDFEDWKTFPTVTDGIEVVAVVVEIAIEKRVEQPDGSQIVWSWKQQTADRESPYLKWLVQSDGVTRPIVKVTEKSRFIGRDMDWFQQLAPDEDDREADSDPNSARKRLGYHLLKLGHEYQDQAPIKLPAGRIELSINTVYGKPSEKLASEIDNQPRGSDEQLWLRGVKSHEENGWLELLIGDSSEDLRLGRTRTFDVAADGREEITIGIGNAEVVPSKE